MIKITNRICTAHDYKAIITGESVGQVASQTIMALGCTDKAAEYPVFRPVIGMDKKEITEIARRIGTFETSIQPYEDCCTIFVAKHPVTKPNLNIIKASEACLPDIEDKINEAIATEDIIVCKADVDENL
jgi:thiamine biosynthesis protein ThiI